MLLQFQVFDNVSQKTSRAIVFRSTRKFYIPRFSLFLSHSLFPFLVNSAIAIFKVARESGVEAANLIAY